MKQTLLFLLFALAGASAFCQSDKYKPAMLKNIGQLDSAAVHSRLLPELANNFERIGDAEKTQWLPYYYAAYCTVMSAYLETDKSKTDPLADRAEALLTKAATLSGQENSEIWVIRSMIASAHMLVDPQTRWQKWGQPSSEAISKARALDPSNPRPVYLEAQSKFYTPESFGGGKAPAKELFVKALQMFDSFKPQSDLAPVWGKASARYFLAQCN